MKSVTQLTLAMLCLNVISGCAKQYVEVEEVLNHNACKGLTKGLHSITAAQLPALRGVTLLEANGTADQADAQLMSGGVLVAVSNGEQPSTGFAMHPDEAILTETHLALNYSWHTPDPARQYAQMLSTPCSVIRLPPEQVEKVSITVAGQPLGTLDIQGSAQQRSTQ